MLGQKINDHWIVEEGHGNSVVGTSKPHYLKTFDHLLRDSKPGRIS